MRCKLQTARVQAARRLYVELMWGVSLASLMTLTLSHSLPTPLMYHSGSCYPSTGFHLFSSDRDLRGKR